MADLEAEHQADQTEKVRQDFQVDEGGNAGPRPYSGAGGGAGGATVVVIDGTAVAVAGGGGGGAGAGATTPMDQQE